MGQEMMLGQERAIGPEMAVEQQMTVAQEKAAKSCWVERSSVGWFPVRVSLSHTEEESGWGLAQIYDGPWDQEDEMGERKVHVAEVNAVLEESQTLETERHSGMSETQQYLRKSLGLLRESRPGAEDACSKESGRPKGGRQWPKHPPQAVYVTGGLQLTLVCTSHLGRLLLRAGESCCHHGTSLSGCKR